MNYYLMVWKKYTVFNGRARRAEYWNFVLFTTIITIVASILDNILGTKIIGTRYGLFGILYTLAVITPAIAVGVRRLHDIGKSGWMLLICLIPIIGPIWFIVLMTINSNPEDNKYGPNPKMILNTTPSVTPIV